jgi:hypothetical protein
MMKVNWGDLLVSQLEFYWGVHLRPRLEGLTDEEYFWEPVEGSWSVRPDESGAYRTDGEWPEPVPAPVTTIAWRLMHIGAGCLANRASAFFGDGSVPDDATMFDPRHLPELPATAAGALDLLDRAYRHWHDGVAALDEDAIQAPLGPKGGRFADDPMAGLILHINREVMHHGGEICLLRDLYRATGAAIGGRLAR